MPANHLQQQLEELQEQLAQNPPLNEEDREHLLLIARDIELQLAAQPVTTADASLLDGVNLAVERFEVSHPTIAGSLRNIMQSLANMGI